jgi:hypothetical protein
MAFVYNSGGFVTGTSSANPIQFNYTGGTDTKLVVLAINHLDNASAAVTGTPTYDGNNMSQAGSFQSSAEGGNEIWYYLTPVASSKQISIPNGNLELLRYNVSDYTNSTESASYFNAAGTSTGSSANVVETVNSVPDGSVCVSCMVHGEKDQFASVSVLTSFHATPSIDEGAKQSGAGYSIQSTTGNETHTYTSGGSADDYSDVMAAWEPSVADVDVNVNEANPDVTDAVTVLIPFWLVSVFDSVGVTEDVAISIAQWLASASDDLTVTDAVDVDIPTSNLDINVFDSVGVSEDVTLHQIDLLTNCDLYYACEDNAASSLVDDATTNYDGAIVNDQNNYSSEQTTAGKINAAFDLDGTNDWIDPNNTLASIFQGSFTIAFWFEAADGQLYESLFGLDDASNHQVNVEKIATGKIAFNYMANGNKGNTAVSASALLSDGQESFHHLAVVADDSVGGVGGKKIYFDGSLVTLDGSNDGSTSGVTFSQYAGSINPLIGANNASGTPSSAFDGVIDEIGIWSEALNASEIEKLYNSGNGLGYPFGADRDVSVFDSITVTEDVSLEIDVWLVSVFGSVGITDAVSLEIPVLVVSVFDSVEVTEGVQAELDLLLASAFESVEVTDDVSLEIPVLEVSVFDSIGVAEGTAAELPVLVVSVDDTVGLTDATSLLLDILLASADDSPSITDAVTIQRVDAGTLNVSVADDIGLTDAVTCLLDILLASVFDSIEVTEGITIQRIEVGVLNVNVADDIGLTDATSEALDLYVALAFDALTVTEDVTIERVAAGALNINVDDDIGLTDAVSAQLPVLVASVADTVAVSDATVASFNLYTLTVTDNVTVGDSASTALTLYEASVADNVDVAESVGVETVTAFVSAAFYMINKRKLR